MRAGTITSGAEACTANEAVLALVAAAATDLGTTARALCVSRGARALVAGACARTLALDLGTLGHESPAALAGACERARWLAVHAGLVRELRLSALWPCAAGADELVVRLAGDGAALAAARVEAPTHRFALVLRDDAGGGRGAAAGGACTLLLCGGGPRWRAAELRTAVGLRRGGPAAEGEHLLLELLAHAAAEAPDGAADAGAAQQPERQQAVVVTLAQRLVLAPRGAGGGAPSAARGDGDAAADEASDGGGADGLQPGSPGSPPGAPPDWARLPALRSLECADAAAPLTAAAAAGLARATGLTSLALTVGDVEEGVDLDAVLRGLTALRRLALVGAGAPRARLSSLGPLSAARMPRLASLHLAWPKMRLLALTQVYAARQLRRLLLSCEDVGDEGLQVLAANLEQLRVLGLGACGVSVAAVRAALQGGCLPELRQLVVADHGFGAAAAVLAAARPALHFVGVERGAAAGGALHEHRRGRSSAMEPATAAGSAKRKREGARGPPGAHKRSARAPARSPAPPDLERARAAVVGLYAAYRSLTDGPGGEGAFGELLAASRGEAPARRLAARLLPRFAPRFPGRLDEAAGALIALHAGPAGGRGRGEPALDAAARRDALAGLGAVLRAAAAAGASQGGSARGPGDAAVKLVLDHLLRLLPQAPGDGDDEPSEPEEEGEVAAGPRPAASLASLRALLLEALRRHPAATMGHCLARLRAHDQQLLAGVRAWLRGHLLAADEAAPATQRRGRRCPLARELEASSELQAWLVQQARGRGSAPSEVRGFLETALQLLPEHQLAAARPCGADHLPPHTEQPHGSPAAAAAPDAGRTPRHDPGGGGGWGSLPAPPGPVCRVQPCLLVHNLPPGVTRQELAAALGAQGACLAGGGSPRACATFEGVLDAAKAFLRHNGTLRLARATAPLRLSFADALPATAGVAAEEASCFVWANRDAAGDAESVTERLRGAGLALSHVHRVSNAAEPGTLLQAPSGAHAARIAAFLASRHPPGSGRGGEGDARQPQAAAAAHAALPPPPGPPPPPLPPKQQQQQADRGDRTVADGGWGNAPAAPPPPGDPGAGDGRHAPPQQPTRWGPPLDAAAAAAQQQQQHAATDGATGSPRQGGGARVLWRGSIVKQSVHMAGVACVAPGGAGAGGGAGAPEPRAWPDALHVNFRISVADALEQYAATPPAQRAVRLLAPLAPGGGDGRALRAFRDYLTGKGRAGMVKLPPARKAGLGPRAVYLIVPQPGVCGALRVAPPDEASLIAVVVPQPGAGPPAPGAR
ncbi:hypothetical protein HT031_006240 [Scenedesmus sp. PABB004]|nr:hypothetical protein HT031_006240 [Scenedesmus sp. PABB004]